MKGTINMEFDGPKTKVKVDVQGVDIASKCAAVDNLLESLNATGVERLLILAMVAKTTKNEEEESKDESRCF